MCSLDNKSMSMGQNLKLDDIADRIIDAILSEPHLSRDMLFRIIRPNLKVWLKRTDEFKSHKVSKDKLQYTIEKKALEVKFWHDKMKALKTLGEMSSLYAEFSDIARREGYCE